MDTFHPFWTLFQKHSFQPFSTLKDQISLEIDKTSKNRLITQSQLLSVCPLSCTYSVWNIESNSVPYVYSFWIQSKPVYSYLSVYSYIEDFVFV